MALDAYYELKFYTAAGAPLAVVPDFNWAVMSSRYNHAGLLEFDLAGDLEFISSLEHMSIVELWRSNENLGLDLYKEWSGFIRDPEQFYIRDRSYYTARADGLKILLALRRVAWYAGYVDRSSFRSKKAETILKTLVDYNVGANATTANGRLAAGNRSDISIETDGAGGSTIDLDCSNDVLIEALRRGAKRGGGDFDLVQTAYNPNDFEFQWFLGQLGDDRSTGSDQVIFSETYGNLKNIRSRFNRRNEYTLIIVGGQGEGADRDFVAHPGPDYHVTTNNIEIFVNATDVPYGDSDALTARAAEKAKELQAIPEASFEVVQTDGSYYGKHYGMGDLVSVEYFGVSEVHKIAGVQIQIGAAGRGQLRSEVVQVETEEDV